MTHQDAERRGREKIYLCRDIRKMATNVQGKGRRQRERERERERGRERERERERERARERERERIMRNASNGKSVRRSETKRRTQNEENAA